MAQSQRITMFCIAVLALLLSMINSAELMPQSGHGIRRLIEVKTVDEKGIVTARVVAEYNSKESEGQKSSSESAAGTKIYQDDDEDSREISSGDSETYGESYDMVAHDEPMAPSGNQSSSEASGSPFQNSDSSINSTSKSVDSNSSTVAPINASATSLPTTAIVATTLPNPQTTSSVPTTGTKVTVTTGKQNVTTLSTLSPTTQNTQKNLTTIPPKVTEVKTTTSATTTTTAPPTTAAPVPTKITRTPQPNVTENTTFAWSTAKPNFTDHGNKDNKSETVSSTIATVIPSTTKVIPVKALRDTEKRKTLFGFVTVEILIALLAGALFSVLLVAFLVYRLKKRNEGSYELSETIALRPKEIDEMGKKKEVFV